MSYFKKFTDFLGGFGLFCALVYFVGKYMAFRPDEEKMLAEGLSKLDLFLKADGIKEHRQYIILIVLLFVSVALGRLLKRYPAITLCVSILPLLQIMNMYYTDLLFEYGGFYILVAALHICGNFYEAVYRDRADGKKRTFWATGAVGLICSAAGAAVLWVVSKFSYLIELFFNGEMTDEQVAFEKKLQIFGIDILQETTDGETAAIKLIIVLVLVSVAVSFVLRGVYFIDLILSAVPFVYGLYAWHGDKLVSAPMLVLVPLWVYFLCRVALFVTGGESVRKSE